MSGDAIKQGSHVTYQVGSTTYSAIVRVVHRDKSFTVEARFELAADGKPSGMYLGHRYRLHASDLRASGKEA